MLQELTTQTGAGLWAIASLLFFIAVYAFVAVRLFRTKPEELEAQARLVLDDGSEPRQAGRQS